MQQKQRQWCEQYLLFQEDEEPFLFEEWIYPNTLEDFRNKKVLECGCGGGQHTNILARYAKEIVAVDLNTIEVAKHRNKDTRNTSFVEDDIASMNLNRTFDIVLCIGVIHHTDNPTITFNNLKKHCNKGGRLIIWSYSSEGNFLMRKIVEPFKRILLIKMPREKLLFISKIITVLMYSFVWTIYLIPMLKFLPYYEYFQNFRRLSYNNNTFNIFDKLNAPQTQFITLQACKEWMNRDEFANIHISNYQGISWRISGSKI